MSTAVLSARQKTRPRKIYTGGEKPDLDRERAEPGFTKMEHSLLVDLWAILPPSVHACIVLLILRHTTGAKPVKGQQPEYSKRLGTAYFAEYARCDQQSVRYALAELIKRGVIAEKGDEPGSCQYKCLTADWQRMAEENPWPRRKGPQSAGELEEAVDEQPDPEPERKTTIVRLLPPTVFRPGQKKKLNLETGAKSVTVRAEADTALQVDNRGGDITVTVRSAPVLVKGRNKSEQKNCDAAKSTTSKDGCQVDLGSAKANRRVSEALLTYGAVDEQTVAKLMRTCAGASEDAVLQAIQAIEIGDSVANPIGYLLAMIPKYLQGQYVKRTRGKGEPAMSERERLGWEISRAGRKPRE